MGTTLMRMEWILALEVECRGIKGRLSRAFTLAQNATMDGVLV